MDTRSFIKTTDGWYIPYDKVLRVNIDSLSLYDILGRLHGVEYLDDLTDFINTYK
jgi:hypothetical protein